jgi:mRNA interferase MazF
MPPSSPYPKQGEVWWIDLEPTKGRETNKDRPCLVLQNNAMNSACGTYIVAPLLKTNVMSLSVLVNRTSLEGLDQDRYIAIHQL